MPEARSGQTGAVKCPRGSGSGPALTGVIDQGRGSEVGCRYEVITQWGTLGGK